MPEFQILKGKLEQEWVPAAQRLLGIETEDLPILWDCDFLLGPKADNREDSHVLCEINVSSVAPYPESAVPYMSMPHWPGCGSDTDAVLARTRQVGRNEKTASDFAYLSS